MSQTPVLLILGAGSRVGASIAQLFQSKGYKVAVVSRSRKEEVIADVQIQADLSQPSSVPAAFEEVRGSLGHPNVVVYNAAAVTWTEANDPFQVSQSDFINDFNVNATSVFAAAKEAVNGFRTLPKGLPKTFIYTGNRLNVEPIPRFLTNGTGKAASAYLIADAANAYKSEGFQFYYADERKPDGSPGFKIDGATHADVYWELVNREAQGSWLATFVKDQGLVDFGEKVAGKI